MSEHATAPALPAELLNSLSEETHELEDALIEAGLLFYAAVTLAAGGSLVWANGKGGWGLFVDKRDGMRHALGNAGVRRRVEAASALPVLVEAIRAERGRKPREDVPAITPEDVRVAVNALHALRFDVEVGRW